MFEAITNWDFSVLYFVQENMRMDFLDSVAAILSVAFNAGIAWFVICGMMACFKKSRSASLMVLCAVVLAFLIGELTMKNVICRVRPCNVDTDILLAVSRPTAYSFPSGHTGSSFAAATAIFLWNKKWGIPALILALVIALSRVYLFVHYPTDVMAGALLGVLCAVAVAFVFKKFNLHAKLSGAERK